MRINSYMNSKFRGSDFIEFKAHLIAMADRTKEYDIVVNETPAYFLRYKALPYFNPARLP